jgi:AraC family ethanolamine operon transcriptional activator
MGHSLEYHAGRRGASQAQRAMVEHAEAYLGAHLGRPVRLTQVCRVLGVSERALRNAFYEVRGMGPKRSMLARRLSKVRRALIEPSAEPATVTGVATDYGFYELGRFAAAYRHAFGETPSETLRAAGRKPAA